MADLLRQQTQRGSDFRARIGGEEFAVIETTGTAPAGFLADKLRRAVEEARIPHAASPFGYVTISLGVAECGAIDCASAAELVSRADQALYRAKEEGRNRAEAVAA
ncbi:diguanylate cyclase/phosphodiesterase (GGDEF & EAL domain protein) with PAS/PAC sensor(s) [Pseudohaliea rubra DSM 19751]|uniref:diguanylate cyclase n=1 Tax=Pseudohaliea rubra DSM 19751 TaxID=1265313 RepID=A0A095X175_9GAMM|nr:diguanylate cyclase/phosphodiesterase (GGDEF & EAL domain protein) with PAS/PAC sensor(s) [Pseudohaliea rubra DSM 19751]